MLLALLSFPALSNAPAVEENNVLFPEQRHESIAELVAQFIQKSHYNHVAVDDELSSKSPRLLHQKPGSKQNVFARERH